MNKVISHGLLQLYLLLLVDHNTQFAGAVALPDTSAERAGITREGVVLQVWVTKYFGL
jgi:hypothetical protein